MIQVKTIGMALLPLAMSACAAVPKAAPPVAAPPPMASAYGKPVEVMGADAKRLIAMFGQPRLDIREIGRASCRERVYGLV